MSVFQATYALVAFISFILGIVFAVIDGMLIWAILFFALALMLVLTRIIWNNAVWAEKVTRKWGEDQDN